MKEEGMQHVVNTINAEHKDISLLVNAAGYSSRNRSPNMRCLIMTCT
jgi:short-subunit dehydrogenase